MSNSSFYNQNADNNLLLSLSGLTPAKGSIIVGNASQQYQLLSISADGSLLIADSTQSGGVRWENSLRVQNAGQVVVGNTTSPANTFSALGAPFSVTDPNGVINGIGSSSGSFANIVDYASGTNPGTNFLFTVANYNNDGYGDTLGVFYARGTYSVPTIVHAGDTLGIMTFNGWDGAAFQQGAQIQAVVDGTPTTGSVPQYLQFNTGHSGGTLKEALRIDSSGRLCITQLGATAVGNIDGASLQVVQNPNASDADNAGTGVSIFAFNANNNQPDLSFYFTNSNTGPTTQSAVPSGDWLGSICWHGSDGAQYQYGAKIVVAAMATFTSGSAPSAVQIQTRPTSGASVKAGLTVSHLQSVIVGGMPGFSGGNNAALATTATDGFFYNQTCAGTPTGVPTAVTGRVPMLYDTTNNKLWVYNGAWKGVVLS